MKRPAIAILFAVAAAVTLFSVSPAAAGHRSHHGYGGHAVQRYTRSYRQPVYHGPSVHLDTQYHVDSYHWTPWQGTHSHGHYDVTPHYTPRHFDYGHGGHIDANPWFHH